MKLEGTIAAVATPPGRGGIAVIRLSGDQAYDVASHVFLPKSAHKNLRKMAGYSAVYGTFVCAGRTVDDGLALCFHAPHSYTGEDVVELNCHGSEVLCREILLACYEAGARPALPGEYTQRAFLNGRINLTQAEAVMDLVSAPSRRGAQAAEVALEGSLHREIEELRTSLIQLAGHLAAWVDYPEEDVEALERETFLQTVGKARRQLDGLIDNYDRGLALKRGVRAVIVGSPNVGKSTLFNVLSGFDRSIVTEIAGTTRDVVREEVHIGGMPFFFSDTAGLRNSADRVEVEGIRRSNDEMQNAELVLAVFDGSQPTQEEDLQLALRCEGRAAIGVVNKSDLANRFDANTLEKYFDIVLTVSAHDAQTRQLLEDAILQVLHLSDIDPARPMLGNQRQLTAAQAARIALYDAEMTIQQGITIDAASVCLDEAIAALAALTGEDATEEVLEEVFSKFCVGK